MTRNRTCTRADSGFCFCRTRFRSDLGGMFVWNGDFLFFFNSALLGVGLAMDAFSVSMANGLHDPKMSVRRMCSIAGTFGVFQAVMPMTGWVCVHTIVELFSSFEMFIPWIALILLAYIGGKMLLEGIRGEETEEVIELSAGALFVQGVATSIDALSVGFTISEYDWTDGAGGIGHHRGSHLRPLHGRSAHRQTSSAPSSPARHPFWAASSSSASVWKSSSPASSDGNVFTEPCIRKKSFVHAPHTAPCIFGTVAKKCRGPLEKLLCFTPVRAQFLRLWKNGKVSLLKFRTKKRSPAGFWRRFCLQNLRRFDMLRAENNISNNGRKCCNTRPFIRRYRIWQPI